MEKRILLDSGWKFSLQRNPSNEQQDIIKPEEWYKASIPGTIHTDLFKNELIAEPFYADNELQLQWIDQCDWLYKTTFDFPKDFDKGKQVFLVFEGLDSICDIFINSTSIASTDNMFRSYRFEISKLLKTNGNTLEVLFNSPVKYATDKELSQGKLPVALRSERVYIRKAQYSFGWDWGPCFITSGIWRPVYLSQHSDISIEKLFFETVQITHNEAIAKLSLNLSEKPAKGYKLRLSLSGEGLNPVEKELSAFDSANVKMKLNVKNPKLWWPNNYGQPFLYDMNISILNDSGDVVEEKQKRVGLRTIKLIQKEDGNDAFRFFVNDIPIFAMGANWIPSDSFLTRVDEAEYRCLLGLAQKANMNFIRVWGGGIYENSLFYDLCDELGLMVWQDFMFACASYPDEEDLIKNIKLEVEENVSRLQYHPCIAIWCGNNENEWIWYQSQNKPVKEMPGFSIYHDLIPKILKKIDPDRPYWPSTPYSNSDEIDPNTQHSGNRHQWDLWSRWVDYKEVKSDESLFVTEFGFQGPANYETFKKVIPKADRRPQSRIFEFHNKQVEGPERLYKFLVSHLPVSNDIKEFIYLTQLSQAFALKECLEHWRMRFPKTNGSIIWQLNDCWPVTSWSLIDSAQRPKLSYYFVKEAFKMQITAFRKDNDKLEVVLLNNSQDEFNGNLQIQFIHLPKGKIEDIKFLDVELQGISQQVALRLEIPPYLSGKEIIVLATLRDREKNIVCRNFYTDSEWKHLRLPKAGISIKNEYSDHLILTTNKPAFFVALQNPDIIFKQNGFIVLPNEELIVRYKPTSSDKGKKKISSFCLNQFLTLDE